MRKVLSESAEKTLHKFGEKGLLIYISIIIGFAGSIAAVVLHYSVHTVFHKLEHYMQSWWGFIVPGAGAALAVIFLKYMVKDRGGHGIPSILYSVTRKGGILRKWDMLSRMVASFLTVASGGSAGLEGPIVFTGSAVGSNISTFFKLTEKHRIILIGAGTAAAISAIFNAPLTGMVFALEVILSEWTVLTIIPVAIASITATQISRLILGEAPAFKTFFEGMGPADLLLTIGLGIITGLISVLFARTLERGETVFEKLLKNPWVRALTGGILVGLIFKLAPQTLGEGHNVVQQMISGDLITKEPILILLMILGMKFIGSVFTLSSGGSGGIFAPSLFLGSTTGLCFGKLLNQFFPGTFAGAQVFALTGMAGVIAGVLQAPLTGIFLITEISNGYGLILPLILVSIVSMLVSSIFENGSIYTKQLIKDNNLIRTGSDNRILAELELSDLLEKDCITVTEDTVLKEFIENIKQSKRNQFIVVAEDSEEYLGIIFLHEVRHILFETELYGMVTVGEMMKTDIEVITNGSPLNVIVDAFEKSSSFTLPVIDAESGKYLGLVSKATLFTKYRQELIVQTL